MSSVENSPRWLTELDLARLLKLTQGHPPPLMAELFDLAIEDVFTSPSKEN